MLPRYVNSKNTFSTNPNISVYGIEVVSRSGYAYCYVEALTQNHAINFVVADVKGTNIDYVGTI